MNKRKLFVFKLLTWIGVVGATLSSAIYFGCKSSKVYKAELVLKSNDKDMITNARDYCLNHLSHLNGNGSDLKGVYAPTLRRDETGRNLNLSFIAYDQDNAEHALLKITNSLSLAFKAIGNSMSKKNMITRLKIKLDHVIDELSGLKNETEHNKLLTRDLEEQKESLLTAIEKSEKKSSGLFTMETSIQQRNSPVFAQTGALVLALIIGSLLSSMISLFLDDSNHKNNSKLKHFVPLSGYVRRRKNNGCGS